MDSAIVDPLIKLRKSYQGKLKSMKTKINNHESAPLSNHVVSAYLKDLEKAKVDFDTVQEKMFLACASDTDTDNQIEVSSKFDDDYVFCVSELKLIMESLTASQSVSTPPPMVPSYESVKLPRLELPSFSGKIEDWSSFLDLFVASVHNNLKLSSAQKLQYLKSAIKGDAAKLIKSFQVTDANYLEAFELLKQRFNNTREIVQSIIKRLFNQPHLSKESISGLQSLFDTTSECVRSLKVHSRPVDEWDDVLVFLLTERMDPESRRQWALTLQGTDCPTFQDIMDFLEKHLRGLTASASGGKANHNSNSSSHRSQDDRRAHHGTATSSDSCVVCAGKHPIYRCQKFSKLSKDMKLKKVNEANLCHKCLRSGHKLSTCRMDWKCRKCSGPHSTILHDSFQQSTPSTSSSSATSHTSQLLKGNPQLTHVLLSTALVKVVDQGGKERILRALLDGGSEGTFITKRCVELLGLKMKKTNVKISGISSTSAGVAKGMVTLKLFSCISEDQIEVEEVLVLPTVTGALPRFPNKKNSYPHLQHLQLADPGFNVPSSIDILIGADVTSLVIRDGIVFGKKYEPVAQNTVFGWALSGRVASEEPRTIRTHHVETDDLLRKFWELEEVPERVHLTQEEKNCELFFTTTHERDENGRYVVKLPFKPNISNLGNSREIAVKRFHSVERRFSAKPEWKSEYINFMKEYLDLHHMEPVNKEDLSAVQAYYLPHHFVLKADSTTTKFRVVFDGSCKSTSGLSLNDCLMVGPTIQDDLFSLLTRFRCHKIALKADIGKMYRQFLISSKDCNFQRILWRENPNQPLQEFKLTTVTYGTASAPYLATRCLQQLCEDEKNKFPSACATLESDCYVDDLITGASTTEEAISLQRELCALLTAGGMQLRKWCSNDPFVLNSMSEDLLEKKETLNLDSDSTVKALGIKWNPATDQFVFEVNVPESVPKLTKRILLSELAKVFDPLGWLAPVVIQAKIIFQDLWKIDIGWDEELPNSVSEKWNLYKNELICIKSLSIPRCLISGDICSQQLHGFSDASEKAYAASVYLRTQHSDGSVTVRLVAAKTKVAPLKIQSIPRLELCGALLLSRLMVSVSKALKINCEFQAWTDSTIVLKWLAAFPGRWKTFVANRVSEIQDAIPTDNWHHVISEENPADFASRGISAADLLECSLWWGGPSWLQNENYPIYPQSVSSEAVSSEEKKKILVNAHICLNDDIMMRFSKLRKLERVTAYIFRYMKNLRSPPKSRLTGKLFLEETHLALMYWIRTTQSTCFAKEIEALNKDKKLPANSKLHQLNPFVDKNGLLRVGGRLQNANVPEKTKHQLILPSDHHLTRLIINYHHIYLLHGGFQLLWANLNQKYWILRARDTIRHEIRKCIICRRNRAKTAQQLMGSLPSARVTLQHPFLHSGVDFAGPYHIKLMKGRSLKVFKAYLCVFVCFATKAVHLEAVGDLTADAFIGGFKRFGARRGIPSDLYSDCGTNFVGADRELRTLLVQFRSQFEDFHLQQGTQWHFNPPSAPHQGGIWEAAVKSAKFHLRRVIGETRLTFEEFQTILSQVEACLNSRPLCAMSPDPDDLTALTPGHFLIGQPLTVVPEPSLILINQNRLSRWQLTQQLFQHFWKRWNVEYLTTLQQRFKWKERGRNLQVGDLVLVKEDNFPPAQWKMARIILLHPGADNLVRVVTVKTQHGEMKRPIVKLCPLVSSDE